MMARQYWTWVTILLLTALVFSAGLIVPPPVAATHSIGKNCYVCHSLSSSQVRKNSRAITGFIGEVAKTHPIYCEFCHVDANQYKTEFQGGASTNGSAHPVPIINGDAMYVFSKTEGWRNASGYTGTTITCGGPAPSCHRGLASGNPANPDLGPANYTITGDTTADGYPNHELQDAADNNVPRFVPVWSTNPAANAGASAHLTAAYLHQGSTQANANASYALCFSCHATVQTAYVSKGGHYFKTLGYLIGCSDCHVTHGSSSVRLYRRASSPITTLSYVNGRSVCLDCHTLPPAAARVVPFTTNTGTTVNITVPQPPQTGGAGVPAHLSSSNFSCVNCHDSHSPSTYYESGNSYYDCYRCHSANGAGGGGMPGAGPSDKFVDNGSGDDFGTNFTALSRHNIAQFTSSNSTMCLDCHVISTSTHADRLTYNDLKYSAPLPNTANWGVTNIDDTGKAGANISFCLSCHQGVYNPSWGTGANINAYVDTGADFRSKTPADNITNLLGQGDVSVTASAVTYSGVTPPTCYNTATGAGNDPPSGYTGVPLFAHYTQRTTGATTVWYKLNAMAAPQALPCLDCHYAHGSPNSDLYKSPRGTTALTFNGRNICLDCHNAANTTLEGLNPSPKDPTNPTALNDRNNKSVPAHASSSTRSCSTSQAGGCHNPHAPSCEICHPYPPPK